LEKGKFFRNAKLKIMMWLANGEAFALNGEIAIMFPTVVTECTFINSPIVIKQSDAPLKITNCTMTNCDTGIKFDKGE